MTALDLPTGGTAARLEVPGRVLAQVPVEGDVVVVYVAQDRIGIVRWAVTQDAEVWHHLSGPGALRSTQIGMTWSVWQDGDVLVVGEQERPVAVRLSTGEVVPAPDGTALTAGSTPSWSLPGGAEGRYALDQDALIGRTTVLGPDGDVRFTYQGMVPPVSRVAGRAPDVLLAQPGDGSGVVGLDAITGEVRWRVEDEYWMWPPLLVDDVALLRQDLSLAALDLRTGEVLWDLPFEDNQMADPLTDGRRVLVPAGGRDGHVLAVDLRSGEEVWRAPLPVDTYDVQHVGGGTAVLQSAGGVVGYR